MRTIHALLLSNLLLLAPPGCAPAPGGPGSPADGQKVGTVSSAASGAGDRMAQRSLPRWATVKAKRVNVRRGPSTSDPVLWTYVRPGVPVEVVAEYGSWLRIRDKDNAAPGWVRAAMLERTRHVFVTGAGNVPLREAPRPDAPTVAYAAPDLIARLDACAGDWCSVSVQGYNGFLPRRHLWGVYPTEMLR